MKKTRVINGWFVLLLLVGLMVVFTGSTFSASTLPNDISGHWASEQIVEMVNKNMVSGYPDGTFKPDRTISRAEFITLANRAFSLQGRAVVTFSDVKAGDWFYSEIARAVAAGYISGYEDGTIRPNQQISRQEAAAIVARVMGIINVNSGSTLDVFVDAVNIPNWSRNTIAAMVHAGLISGYPDGSIRASDPIKRAEAVVLFKRSIELKGPTEPVQPGIPRSDEVALSQFGGSMILQTIGDERIVTLMIIDVAGAAASFGVTEEQISNGQANLALTYASQEYTFELNDEGFLEIVFTSTTLKDETIANELQVYKK